VCTTSKSTNIPIEVCSTAYMQPPITDATKRAVIEEYLRGKTRDPIASDLHLGTKTVSKIIKEWKIGLDAGLMLTSCVN
jgi:hypothetical protein